MNPGKVILILTFLGATFNSKKLIAQQYSHIGSTFVAEPDANYYANVSQASVRAFAGDFSGYFKQFGTSQVFSAGGRDAMIIFTNSSLSPTSLHSAGGPGDDAFLDIDASGSSYYTGGYFSLTANFNSQIRISNGLKDAFIAGYSQTSGASWVTAFGGTGNDQVKCIRFFNGIIYTGGTFTGSMIIGNDTLHSNGQKDIFIASFTSSGVPVWAKSLGSTSDDEIYNLRVNSSGIYFTGTFSNTVVFGNTSITSAGGTDSFISRYNLTGSPVWVKHVGGLQDDRGTDIAILSNGMLSFTGVFRQTITWGASILNSSGQTDIFVLQTDTATGTPSTAYRYGGTGRDSVSSISSDATNNLYLCGSYDSTCSFGTINLIPNGLISAFTVRLSSSTGNVSWAHRTIINTGECELYSIAISGTTLTVCGTYEGSPPLTVFPSSSTTLSTNGRCGFIISYSTSGSNISSLTSSQESFLQVLSVTSDHHGHLLISGGCYGSSYIDSVNFRGGLISSFLAKCDSSGTPLWIKTASASNNSPAPFVSMQHLKTDTAGNIYVSGLYKGQASFDNLTINSLYPNAIYGEIFLAKYNSNGTIQWVKRIGSCLDDIKIYAMQLDKSSNVLLAGSFHNDMNIPNLPILNNCFPSGGDNGFVGKIDSSGNIVFMRRIAGSSSVFSIVSDVATDDSNNIYICGRYAGGGNFDDFGNYPPPNFGQFSNVFFGKISPSGTTDIWTKIIPSHCALNEQLQISVYSENNILYLSGGFIDSVRFSSNQLLLSSPSPHNTNLFLSRYNSLNGSFVWGTGIFDQTVQNHLGNIVLGNDDYGNSYISYNYRGQVLASDSILFYNPAALRTRPSIFRFDPDGSFDKQYIIGAENNFLYQFDCNDNRIFIRGALELPGDTIANTFYPSTYSTGGSYSQYYLSLFDPCPSSLSFSTQLISGYTYSFSAVNQSESILHWDFGDGNFATGDSVSHNYYNPGSYTVCVSADSSCGLSVCQQITIIACPLAAFNPIIQRDTVSFINTSANATAYLWNFGDGNTSTAQSPVHVYDSSGIYTVCLITSNSCGNDTICSQVCITPEAGFTYTSSSNFTYTFNADTSILSDWLWDFGDGQLDSSSNVTHTYLSNGIYTVCLTAFSNCGSDSVCVVLPLISISTPDIGSQSYATYPSPADNFLIIESTDSFEMKDAQVIITDVSGKSVMKMNMTDKIIRLNVQDLNNGLYFVIIVDNDNLLTYKNKFVINH